MIEELSRAELFHAAAVAEVYPLGINSNCWGYYLDPFDNIPKGEESPLEIPFGCG